MKGRTQHMPTYTNINDIRQVCGSVLGILLCQVPRKNLKAKEGHEFES